MKIVHIAPHYGGGIAPAVAGIVESTTATHYLFGIEETKDIASVNILTGMGLLPRTVSSIDPKRGESLETDVVIFHFWDSTLWAKMTFPQIVCSTRALVLLNHQAFAFNGPLARRVGKLFDFQLQSGFMKFDLPRDWLTVPTCRNQRISKDILRPRANKAVYIGTLDYKKVSNDFFPLAKEFNERGIPVEIYGNLLEGQFANDFHLYRSSCLEYKGYLTEKTDVLLHSTYFFYPLQPNHYGTTENVLLEAMQEGCIPLVKRNPVEVAILGAEILDALDIEMFISRVDSNSCSRHEMTVGISNRLRERAQELTDSSLRRDVWTTILDRIGSSVFQCRLWELASRISVLQQRSSHR